MPQNLADDLEVRSSIDLPARVAVPKNVGGLAERARFLYRRQDKPARRFLTALPLFMTGGA